MSDEIENIRKKRLKELQDAAARQQEQEKQREMTEAYEAQKQSILRIILSDNAKLRLNNIKLVKPQMAESIEDQLVQLYQAGRIPDGISEEQLLQLLKQIQGTKRESKIKFKRV